MQIESRPGQGTLIRAVIPSKVKARLEAKT